MSKRKPRTTRQVSQRERLLGRQRPTVRYPLLVDADGAEHAQQALLQAQARARQVRLSGGDATDADRQVDEAQQALAACYETIVLRALPLSGDVTVETLIAAHPPTAKQMEQAKAERDLARQRGEPIPDWPSWNPDTYKPALLAATAEGDMSADDWREFLAGNVSEGEDRGLWRACLAVNSTERAADPLVLPKGWMTTTS